VTGGGEGRNGIPWQKKIPNFHLLVFFDFDDVRSNADYPNSGQENDDTPAATRELVALGC